MSEAEAVLSSSCVCRMVGKDGLAGVDGTRAIVVVVVVGGGTTWLMRGDTVGGGRWFDSVDEFTTKFRVTTCEFTMVV